MLTIFCNNEACGGIVAGTKGEGRRAIQGIFMFFFVTEPS